MADYKKILVSIDLTAEADQVVEQASSIAARYQADLSLIHVIEPLTFAYGGDIPMDVSTIQEEIETQAKARLRGLGSQWNIPAERQYLIYGRPAAEVHRLVTEQQADLIVIGSHGRHGIGLVLGSTATAVLHGAKCDVLAVRVRSATK